MPIVHPKIQVSEGSFDASVSTFRSSAALQGYANTADPRIRAFSPLPRDAEVAIDETINRVGRESLGFVQGLIDAGLVVPLPNWLGVLSLENRKVNDVGQATWSMEFGDEVRYERYVQDISTDRIPIPGVWQKNDFGSRLLSVADRASWPLELNHVEQSTRNVLVAIEDQGLHGLRTKEGALLKIDGYSAPGIFTNPLNTYEYIGSKSWTASTGKEIVDNVRAMIAMLITRSGGSFEGPFALVLGTVYNNEITRRYSEDIDAGTIRDQLEKLVHGGKPLQIISSGRVEDDYTAIVQLTTNVIDVIVGQGPQSVTWRDGNGPFPVVRSMVLACQIVRPHQTYTAKQGIVVGYKDPL